MIYLRACFKCRGDIFLDRDSYGAYFKCLQCGFSRDIPAPDAPEHADGRAPGTVPAGREKTSGEAAA